MSGALQEDIHILHVDDESDFADLTATFLERESDRFTFETATSADEGIGIVADRSPDCIVSDYDMPGQNGIEFLETVREEYPDLPFILYTGKGSEEVASDALRAGATDYIQKQSGSEQYELLANRIQNAVEQHRSKRRAAALDRIRTLVADINQSLIRASSPEEVKAQVCRQISESTPYVTACFAKVDREAMQIKPQIWAGDAAGYFDQLDMAVDEDSPGRHAPGGRAFHERAIAISQNILEDEWYAKWQDAAAERGFRSLAVVPIEYQDELHGLLATFASRPNAFDQTEQELLEELGDDIGHALHAQTLQTELEQTNDELNTILEHAPVGVILMNHDDGTFRYRRFNRRMEELSGLSSTEIQNETPQKALGPEDGAEVANRYRECIARGEPIEYTSSFEIAGERVIRKGTVAPVTADGDTEQLVVVVQDVTEERRQRMQLEETAARLEALFERSPDMIDIHDTDGNILDANRQLVERTGYGEAELTEMKVWDLDTRITSDEARALWEDMDTNDRQQLEGVYQCRDGSTLPVDVHIRRVDIEDEDLFVAISRDISEQIERKRELEQYERIIENLDDVATIIKPDGTITYVSPSVERLLGYEPADLLGENGFEYQPPETSDAVADAIERVLENPDETHTVQTRFQKADGSWCWIESTLRNRLDDAVIDGILVSSRDITERKRQKEALQEKNKRLEEFTSIVSHDLRNPLQVADGRLEMVRDECESDHIDDVAGALDRMDALIEDLLTLAREGEQADETEPVGLANAATNSWQTVNTEQATLETNTSRAVKADQSRLRQLFENLYRNAIEHGGDDVRVSVGEINDSGFYVADTGPGIPESDREEVFEAGYSTAEKGTGFGLRIVEQVATAHDWDITLTESEQGGARFEVTGVEFADR